MDAILWPHFKNSHERGGVRPPDGSVGATGGFKIRVGSCRPSSVARHNIALPQVPPPETSASAPPSLDPPVHQQQPHNSFFFNRVASISLPRTTLSRPTAGRCRFQLGFYRFLRVVKTETVARYGSQKKKRRSSSESSLPVAPICSKNHHRLRSNQFATRIRLEPSVIVMIF